MAAKHSMLGQRRKEMTLQRKCPWYAILVLTVCLAREASHFEGRRNMLQETIVYHDLPSD